MFSVTAEFSRDLGARPWKWDVRTLPSASSVFVNGEFVVLLMTYHHYNNERAACLSVCLPVHVFQWKHENGTAYSNTMYSTNYSQCVGSRRLRRNRALGIACTRIAKLCNLHACSTAATVTHVTLTDTRGVVHNNPSAWTCSKCTLLLLNGSLKPALSNACSYCRESVHCSVSHWTCAVHKCSEMMGKMQQCKHAVHV